MFALLSNMFDGFLWGVLFSLALAGLLLIILKVCYSPFRLSFLGGIIGVVLYVCLLSQCTLFVGAAKVRGMVTDWASVTAIEQWFAPASDYLAEEQLSEQLSAQLDIDIDENLQTAADAVQAVNQSAQLAVEGVRAALSAYMWRRAMWMAGLLVVGGILIGRTRKKPTVGLNYDSMTDFNF